MPTGIYTRKPYSEYTPRVVVRKDPLIRFWKLVNKDGPIPESISFPELKTPCWMWNGSMARGYGRFWVDGKHVGAHIYSYVIAYGTVPDGLELDHCCRVTRCVRPDHLEAVTSKVNGERSLAVAATKARSLARTHCYRGHEFTPENTLRKANRGRLCRICKNLCNKMFMRKFHKEKRGYLA